MSKHYLGNIVTWNASHFELQKLIILTHCQLALTTSLVQQATSMYYGVGDPWWATTQDVNQW